MLNPNETADQAPETAGPGPIADVLPDVVRVARSGLPEAEGATVPEVVLA